MGNKYVRADMFRLKEHPEFDENWLKDRILDDPSILGLGDVEVRAVERVLPKAGRLDLLMRDPETGKRYEVEIMLGDVDESHIIRVLEYWDVERKRYPQYDHCAVIVAEGITSRFLNVISLFNSAIPLIAIQLNAYTIEDNVFLTFTKVLDEIVLGDEEDEDIAAAATREYWENRASKESLTIADECLPILKEVKPELEFKYNKYYIGLAERGRPNNFVIIRAKKKFIRVEVRITDQTTWKSRLEEVGFTVLGGTKQRARLIFTVTRGTVAKNRELLKGLFEASYREQEE